MTDIPVIDSLYGKSSTALEIEIALLTIQVE